MAKPTKHRGKYKIRWNEGSRRRAKSFDSYDEARRALRAKEQEQDEARRGLRAAPGARTFGDLCDYWIEHRAPRKRSGKDDESIIRKHLRPSFGPLLLDAINAEPIDRFINGRAHLEKKTVENQLILLRAMLHVAVELAWLARAPKVPKVCRTWRGGDYSFLERPEDVQRFLNAARRDENVMAYPMYATAVLTGMRAGELAGLQWADVNFETRIITVRRSFATETKTELIRHVPIGNDLLPVLEEWRNQNPLPLVFPNERGRTLVESARIFQEVLHRVLRLAGFPLRHRKGKLRPHIHFHELRHTFASHWAMRGGCLLRLQRILGHQSREMTDRYAHLAPHAFTEDYDRLSELVPPKNAEPKPPCGDTPKQTSRRVFRFRPKAAARVPAR